MLHPEPSRSVERYLEIADRLMPGRISGFYLVGSTALGAYRPGRSDIDFVAVVDGGLTAGELRRLRVVHVASGLRTGARALARGHLALPGTCNGVYVSAADLHRPVTTIRPLASHTGIGFAVGAGGDVNPVGWKVFLEAGITIRGVEPGALGLDPEPERLRPWNRDNLDRYWRPWAEATLQGAPPMSRTLPRRWVTAWGVLGPPRLHHTIATGAIVSKERAGEYALDVFASEWHPLVSEALAFWRGEPADPAFADPAVRNRRTAEFAFHVIETPDRGEGAVLFANGQRRLTVLMEVAADHG